MCLVPISMLCIKIVAMPVLLLCSGAIILVFIPAFFTRGTRRVIRAIEVSHAACKAEF